MVSFSNRYIEQLKAETNHQQEVEARATPSPVDPRVSDDWEPITAQIKQTMLSLPSALKAGPFSLDFFQSKIHGKYKPSASAGDIGIALTSLGFTRKRDPSGRRFWLPPHHLNRNAF
jgi:hypothetical protein